MTNAARAIDGAMAEDRPAKKVVRGWWLEQARSHATKARDLGVPLYLTLPGAHGHDIQALIDGGLVRTNDSGGILDDDSELIVAFEKNMMAYGELKKRFPNLRVRQGQVQDLVGRHSDVFPRTSADKLLCRAAVVNLDFNGPYAIEPDGSVHALRLAEKFAVLHEGRDAQPPGSWTFCLTLRAIVSSESPQGAANEVSFLVDQAGDSPVFSEVLSLLVPWINDDKYSLFDEDDPGRLQHVLMCLVPARLARIVAHRGWRITAIHIAAYGHDGPRTAPMVTFVIALDWDDATRAQPNAGVRASHGAVLQAVRYIAEDGTVTDGPVGSGSRPRIQVASTHGDAEGR